MNKDVMKLAQTTMSDMTKDIEEFVKIDDDRFEFRLSASDFDGDFDTVKIKGSNNPKREFETQVKDFYDNTICDGMSKIESTVESIAEAEFGFDEVHRPFADINEYINELTDIVYPFDELVTPEIKEILEAYENARIIEKIY